MQHGPQRPILHNKKGPADAIDGAFFLDCDPIGLGMWTNYIDCNMTQK